MVAAARLYDKADPVNIGSAIEISIRELATTVASQVGFGGRFVWDTSKPNGQPRRSLDVTRATREFGFQASTRLEQGLRTTIDWYLKQGSPGRRR